MRSSAWVLALVAVIILVPSPAAGAGGEPRLPAPVTVQIGTVAYQIGRDGHVRRTQAVGWPYPKDAACCAAPGVWFAIRHRHLVVGRGGGILWLSRGKFARQFTLGAVRVGSQTVAFTYGNDLYIAPLNGSERLIGHAELPLGFTDGGLYTYQWGGSLRLRSDAGALLTTIGRPFGRSEYTVIGRNLYFLSDRALIEAQGTNVAQLASLHALGLSRRSVWIQSAGPLIELQDTRHLVLLRADGSVFASTLIPRRHGQTESISSFLTLNPRGDTVAFVAALESGRSSSATETVYLLHAGARASSAAHSAWVSLGSCERWASVQWHGRWLIYSDTGGELTVIDSSGAHPAIDLTQLARGLSRFQSTVNAYWSGQPPSM